MYLGKKLMVIPLKGQYEQECNSISLKEMGIFIGELNDIEEFIKSPKVTIEKWDDPINDILNKILNI